MIGGKQKQLAWLIAGAAFAAAVAPHEAAHAQAASDESASTSGEVVVTARRRSEALQDVPVAVSTFSGEALEASGAGDITALQRTVPNLTLQVARGSNSTLIAFIRGVGQQDPLWGFDPGVGLYVDDAYIARPQAAVLDIFDVERIEVLRGPQGSLYGRNTIGGAVKYVTRRLDDQPTATMKLAAGSYEQTDVIVSGSTPIANGLSIGGAAAFYRRDGFGTNITTGAEHYDKNVDAFRLSAEWTPSANLFFRLSADRVEDNSNARHGHREEPLVVSSVTVPGTEVLPNVFDTRAGLGDDNKVETEGYSLTGEWAVSDSITLKSITATREGETKTNIDFDNSPSPLLDVPAIYEDSQVTQELQLLYEGDRIQGVAGLFYLNSTASGAFDTIVSAVNTTTGTAGKVSTISLAAFADVSIDITDQWSLSLGGRYTEDQKRARVFRANYAGTAGSPLTGRTSAAPTLLRTNYTNEETFSEFTPRVSLTYEPSDALTLYTSYSRGFKSGGFDMRGDAIFTPNTVNGYDPEFVDTYEVGAKASLFNGRLRVNAAVFQSDYQDQQITRQEPTTLGTVASFVDNAASVEVRGAELEGSAVLTDWLTANIAIGVINGEYGEYITRNAAGDRLDLSSTAGLQNTPETTGALSFVAQVPVPFGSLQVIPAASYRSEFRLFEFAAPALDPDAVTLYELSAVWTAPNERVSFAIHGKNLSDEEYQTAGYNFGGATFGNSIISFYGPPRTVTGTLTLKY